MKGYKAFKTGWECRGFQYELGKTYELEKWQKLEMCKCGFHFCANPIDVFGYYPMSDDTLIAEVEALGEIQQEGTKYVTNKIRIVKEFTKRQLQDLILSGYYNRGEFNSGNLNSGNLNSGHCNSGDCNSGDGNSGDYNSGGGNSGDYNNGDCNSGNYNSGHCNSGDCNSGSHNAGYYNSGRYNSGDYNSGNHNAGYYNSGDYNNGFFNTDTSIMWAFNKPCQMTFIQYTKSLNFSLLDLCHRIHERALLPEDFNRIKSLPNFDAEIFNKITGIKIN